MVLTGAAPAVADAIPPTLPLPRTPGRQQAQASFKAIFDKEGPAAFAKAVRKHK